MSIFLYEDLKKVHLSWKWSLYAQIFRASTEKYHSSLNYLALAKTFNIVDQHLLSTLKISPILKISNTYTNYNDASFCW